MMTPSPTPGTVNTPISMLLFFCLLYSHVIVVWGCVWFCKYSDQKHATIYQIVYKPGGLAINCYAE